MLSVQRCTSPCYSHCKQTVTLYHQAGPEQYHRTVIHDNAYLDFRKNSNMDKLGSRESNSFLLVLPQGADGHTYLTPTEYAAGEVENKGYTVAVNDKVLLGEGQEIATAQQWSGLIPSKVDGLVVIKYIDPKYWQGSLCHLEVGG